MKKLSIFLAALVLTGASCPLVGDDISSPEAPSVPPSSPPAPEVND